MVFLVIIDTQDPHRIKFNVEKLAGGGGDEAGHPCECRDFSVAPVVDMKI